MQDLLLRFFCEQELPLVVWTDNGGPFRNVIQAALEQSIGVKPRHIPPGRPQANSLVEVYNRILDSAHGGERDRLLSAVVAYNHMPQPRFGASPETLWRVLRPPHSRWRNLQVANLLHGPKPELTDEQWLHYLCEEDKFKVDHYKQAADKFHETLKPVQEAMASKHLRENMQRALKYDNKRTQSSDAPLLSGDRVIAKNTQYTSKTGKGKFETKDGEVREYVVLSVSQGFVQVEDIATGSRMCKHEANLKLMPSALEPDDSNVSKPPEPDPSAVTDALHYGPFLRIPALMDGACLYRSLNMALHSMAGVAAEDLVDDGGQAQALRSKLLLHMQLWLQHLPDAEKAQVTEKVDFEMMDDPVWAATHGHQWTWASILRMQACPRHSAPLQTLRPLSAAKASLSRSTSAMSKQVAWTSFGLNVALEMVALGAEALSASCALAFITIFSCMILPAIGSLENARLQKWLAIISFFATCSNYMSAPSN